MAWDRFLCFSSILFFLFTALSVSASSFISAGVFESGASSTGRNLLQAKKSCPIDFESQNYTILTSKCKGPQYPPSLCCQAFKEFACPIAADINDESNDCASTMFSYINLYGKYPPALFSSGCREGKEGLSCEKKDESANSNANSGQMRHCSTLPVLLASGFFLLFHIF